ncbi:mitochondrial antiviral-signaling protein [Odontesthes bonariensis]|uniref:mitochondrial antiviral-signaling protein n=1 Tax=Odontesthes bonariensis TaxID=219752 RepID=UPI003F58BFFB
MSCDELYNGYLRRNMPTIVSRVKVREIIFHLPCLTLHDRENIEAKRETCGNYDGMVLLLDCLKRRENWPEQFIEALEACEQRTLAAEIRAAYNALKGVNNSNPGSTPTTVIKAHVHPSPADSHFTTPERGGNGQAAVAPPAVAPPAVAPPAVAPPAVAPPAEAPPAEAPAAPSEPAAQAPPSLETPAPQRAPQSGAGQVAEGASPPESVPEPPQSTIEVRPLPSTPPPSPETPCAQVTDFPLPQTEVTPHQDPEENTESDIQNVSGAAGLIPDEVSSSNEKFADNFVTTPPSVPLQTAVTTNDEPLQSSTQINSDISDGSSFPTMTPVKHPVQDSSPPVNQTPTAVQQPETSESTQIVESSPKTKAAATTAPEPHADADDNSVCLSKPGQLVSIQPQNHPSPTVQASNPVGALYSGNSERLEISAAAPDPAASTYASACSAVSSTIAKPSTPLPCQENGIAPSENEPEENHYESPNQSVVFEEVVHVSEVPSILNLDGQNAPPHLQITNGEAAKEIIPEPSINATDDTVSSLTGESNNAFKPASADASREPKPLQEEAAALSPLTQSTKYILTAAGVGACALLLAWKLKK